MSQLALPLKLEDHAVFESFLATGNEAAVAFLQNLVGDKHEPGGWLRGASAVGKTHLLQALCERAEASAQYLPIRDVMSAGAEILDGLATRRFVCLDDVDVVSGSKAWELGLFRLFNDVAEAGGTLLCSASAAPRDCGFDLADLASRFSLLPVYQLHALGDDERIEALQLRARHRGLDLPFDTATYLLSRNPRDMASLYEILDKLDSESMVAQRRLTIPFVRDVMESR